MRPIKYILSLLLFTFVCQLTFAGGAVTLVLKLRDSDAVEKYKLATKPVLTFENGTTLRITTSDVETTRDYADVEKFYFDVEEDEIIDPDTTPDPGPTDEVERIDENQNTSFEFAYDGRYAQLKGLEAKEQVAVFSVDGKRMQPKTVASPSAVTISMYELPSGVYIIRTANRSIKIIRK